MNIEEIKKELEYERTMASNRSIVHRLCDISDFLLSELDRLRADRQLENDLALPPCTLTLKREVERWKSQAERLALGVKNEWDANEELRSRLAAQLGECERLKALLTSHGPEGHNVTNEQFVEMRDEVERLKESREDDIANYCNDILAQFAPEWVGKSDLFTWIKCTVAKLQAAEARAAQHLADQDYLVALERKRVARGCAEIAETHRTSHGSALLLTGCAIGRKIRTKYEVGE